jgi:hypothetical protein
MTAISNVAADARAGAVAGDPAAPAASGGPFVLNLCSSTTPMALAQTELPELKRFTFFVSRRFEEGRERFRLHMGYFATLAEAEEWLALVREIYPGAWAGEAPGRKLRERAAAAAAAQATHTAGPQPRVAAPPAAAPEAIPLNVPVVHAARPALSAPTPKPREAARPAAAPVTPPAQLAARAVASARAAARAAVATASAAPAAPRPAPVAAAPQKPAGAPAPAARPAPPRPSVPMPANQAAPAARPAAPPSPKPPLPKPPSLTMRPGASPAAPAPRPAPTAGRVAPQPAAPAAAKPVAPSASAPAAAAASRPAQPSKPGFGDSNVREVLAALTDSAPTGETRQMPVAPPRPAAIEVREESALSDTQVLKMLEARGAQSGQAVADQSEGGIPLLKPDDTATRRALQEALANNAPVSFAVQLLWSVQPVELDKVPPLAIFSAYTLYTVEGSRDGRRWHGLRLGFFSDVISAKQVAGYVRSEFASVAVVPVSPQERGRATEQHQDAGLLGTPVPVRTDSSDEFKLFDDDRKPASPAAVGATIHRPLEKTAPAPRAQPKVAAGRMVRHGQAAPSAPSAPAAPARGRGAKVAAGAKRGPQTLEETLEILGASALTIDGGSGETLNDTGVRHLRIEQQKNSPFGRLLERLSERVKKQ